MSVGPTGFFGTVAALPPSPPSASDADHVAQESSAQAGQLANDERAENAQGIGATDGEEHATAERDADGRRLFEKPLGRRAKQAVAPEPPPSETHQSKDPTGESGQSLDLTG